MSHRARFAATTFVIALAVSFAAEAVADSARAVPPAVDNPYRIPEVQRLMLASRDLLLASRHEDFRAHLAAAEKKYPDLLAWPFAALLAEQIIMVERRDKSRTEEFDARYEEFLDEWDEIADSRVITAWDYMFLGGIKGMQAIQLGRKGNPLKAFITGVKAVKLFFAARDADPDLYDMYLGIGVFHYVRGIYADKLKFLPVYTHDVEKGRRELALAHEKGLLVPPLVEIAWLFLALEQKEYERALPHAQSAAAQYPTGLVITQELAYLHYKLGDTEDAIDVYERIIGQRPTLNQPHYYYGICLFKVERYADARRELEYFLTVADDDKSKSYAHYVLAEIDLKEMNFAGARDRLRRATALHRGYAPAKKRLRELDGLPDETAPPPVKAAAGNADLRD